MEEFVAAVLDLLADEIGGVEALETIFRGDTSNDVAEVRFADGRTLMIKRAQVPGSLDRFATSRLASRLLREHTKVVVPVYLELPPTLDDQPGLAYWRIDRPTLSKLWKGLDPEARESTLRSWGRLMRRIHEVRLPGHGLLLVAVERPVSLAEFLSTDLEGRLRPAVERDWRRGLRVIDALIEAIPAVSARVGRGGGVLAHNDLWYANILCAPDGDAVRCVGVLDFEDVLAGPPELDVAKTEVVHGPLFGNELTGDWLRHLCEGYGDGWDPLAIRFFRTYHRINMGYHAAVVGHRDHADEVARFTEKELDALDASSDPLSP